MNIYLLELEEEARGYDKAFGFVVIAKDEKRARNIIAYSRIKHADYCYLTYFGREGPKPWLDKKQSTCKKIGEASPKKKEGVILRDYHSG